MPLVQGTRVLLSIQLIQEERPSSLPLLGLNSTEKEHLVLYISNLSESKARLLH